MTGPSEHNIASSSSSAAAAPAAATSRIRTCIGCRKQKADHTLVRMTVVDGDFLIDERGRGRGAWMCRDSQCVEAAAKGRAFSRAFRSKLADRVLADTLLGWLDNPSH